MDTKIRKIYISGLTDTLMKKILVTTILIFALIFSFTNSPAFTYVVSNSEDWKDVYSTTLYANLLSVPNDFLVSTPHATVLLNGINKEHEIKVVSSRRKPYIFNYQGIINSRGFRGAEEVQVNSANLELIQELPEIRNFIIVNPNYGYSAVAVAPYAIISDSWVFFTDRTNIVEVESIISARNPQNVLIYGYVDREVSNSLEQFNPEIINTGDRFNDNVEIVKRYQKLSSSKQAILTNGDFIEKEIMSGANPVLFTGKENVPEQIRDYIVKSDIEIGVLIGNDLMGSATNIRRSTGISVIVKFARGAREQTAGISAVEGLDLFYLPRHILELEIHSIRYNLVNNNLLVTIKSNSNTPAYFKSTINVLSGTDNQVVGDVDPIFISPGDFKTISYPDVDIRGDSLRAEVFTLYGEGPLSLDRVLQGTYNITLVNVIDNCEIDITQVIYSQQKKSFIIPVKNTEKFDCYVDIELNDVIINGFRQTIGTDGSEFIKAGRTKKIYIKETLTDEDLEENPFVNLEAYYGEREDSLIKLFKGRFELKIQKYTMVTYIIISLIILIILILLILFWIRRRNDEDDY
jgi:hypothetical protein